MTYQTIVANFYTISKYNSKRHLQVRD